MSKDDEDGQRRWSGGSRREPERRGEPDWFGEDDKPRQQRSETPQAPFPLDDPLPQFSGFAPPDRVYVPFTILRRTPRLHIHCATQPSQFPAYHYLANIIFPHDFGSGFVLVYTTVAVEVTGRNLGPIVHALSFHACGTIREFHSKLYDPPAKDTPLIEGIRFRVASAAPEREREREREDA